MASRKQKLHGELAETQSHERPRSWRQTPAARQQELALILGTAKGLPKEAAPAGAAAADHADKGGQRVDLGSVRKLGIDSGAEPRAAIPGAPRLRLSCCLQRGAIFPVIPFFWMKRASWAIGRQRLASGAFVLCAVGEG